MSTSIKTPDENPSNVESILSDTIGLPGYTINPPGSRIETLLIELNELIKGGGGGGSDAYAADLSLTIDSSTYVITAVLKNQNGESIGTPQTIDLPMESVVVSGSYNSQTKKVVLTLQNGSTVEFSVADLIDGLQSEITSANKLDADLVDDSTSTNKFVTSGEKSTWNGKQNALSSAQLDAVNSGIDSTKVAQIETNKNNISSILDGTNIDSFGDAETALATKVDKETGKGLSTNDFTTAEKTKLDDLAEIKSVGTGLNLDSTTGELTADIPTVPITAIQKNGTGITPVSGTVNIIVPTTAADVSALPDTTKYATALSLTINSSTFVMTAQLKDQNGDNLGTAQTIDLPLESVVVGGSYDSQTKKVVLTLQNGNTIEFSVADLVSGLQTELSASNKLNPEFINYDSTHRAVSDTEKSTWNGKQNALSSAQLDAVNSKMTRKQAITNGMYLVEEPPKAVTHPDTGDPYIYVSFSIWGYIFDSVASITTTQFGIIYCNDGTARVDDLRLENVDGVHIIKYDDYTGRNLPVSGTNPVKAVGFGQYQDADGVTSDVLYTKNLGGDYRLLNAPSDIVALQQTIGDIETILSTLTTPSLP